MCGSVKMRQMVEREIATALIRDGLAAGYFISVNNGGDEDEIKPSRSAEVILGAMFATDDEHLRFFKDGKCVGWVYFIYCNSGWDTISDYSCSLEHIMAGADEVSNKYQ